MSVTLTFGMEQRPNFVTGYVDPVENTGILFVYSFKNHWNDFMRFRYDFSFLERLNEFTKLQLFAAQIKNSLETSYFELRSSVYLLCICLQKTYAANKQQLWIINRFCMQLTILCVFRVDNPLFKYIIDYFVTTKTRL